MLNRIRLRDIKNMSAQTRRSLAVSLIDELLQDAEETREKLKTSNQNNGLEAAADGSPLLDNLLRTIGAELAKAMTRTGRLNAWVPADALRRVAPLIEKALKSVRA